MVSKKLANKYQYDDLLIRSKDPYANAKYEVLLGWLKNKKVRTVLNAGCGSGEFCFMLAKEGYKVTGIDPDQDYIELARRNVDKSGVRGCRFETAKIEEFVAKVKYDVVIATDVLEHIEDDEKAFVKLANFVKPGGIVLITVPAGQYLFGYHDVKLGHYRRYSLKSFGEIVPSGVRTKKLRYFGFFMIPVALLMSKIIKKSYPVASSGDANKSPLVSRVLKVIFWIEKKCEFVLGTSLLFLGKKK